MFAFIASLDAQLYERCGTVEKNLKAASNSFYDAYLDLQEAFLRATAQKEKIPLSSHATCGDLLHFPQMKTFLLVTVGVDPAVYAKMEDYTLKVNRHKHKSEKEISAELAVKYLAVFHTALCACFRYWHLPTEPFDEAEIRCLYGALEKENQALRAELAEIKRGAACSADNRRTAARFMSEATLDGLSAEEQNRELRRQIACWKGIAGKVEVLEKAVQELGARINDLSRETPAPDAELVLRDFVNRAKKMYRYFGTDGALLWGKLLLLFSLFGLFATGIVSTALTTGCLGVYSTFSFFENIVVYGGFFVFLYTLRAGRFYETCDLARHTTDVFAFDERRGVWYCTGKEKKRYRIFRRIAYFAVAGNLFAVWTLGAESALPLKVTATVFEILFLVFTVASYFLRVALFCQYETVYFTGKNYKGTDTVTLVFDPLIDTFMPQKQYEETYLRVE